MHLEEKEVEGSAAALPSALHSVLSVRTLSTNNVEQSDEGKSEEEEAKESVADDADDSVNTCEALPLLFTLTYDKTRFLKAWSISWNPKNQVSMIFLFLLTKTLIRDA